MEHMGQPWAPHLLFSFSLSIWPHSGSVQPSVFLPLVCFALVGKLCVYFKNHFAAPHIPAFSPASCCRATWTWTLLWGLQPEAACSSEAPGSHYLTGAWVNYRNPIKCKTFRDSSPSLSFSSSFLSAVILSMFTPLPYLQFHRLSKTGNTILEILDCLNIPYSSPQTDSNGFKMQSKNQNIFILL